MTLIIWLVLAYLGLRWALPAALSLAFDAINNRIEGEIAAALGEPGEVE